ncbi:cysteinyl-tRNA synthetase [Streptomyces dysideae]|uniref:Cysteinyl-tRNA synthetase n=1 Tax=Streptomyces dysideae TaxID=909626 RepID=A0A101UUR8_9ACTN|nr:cysteinyl-tRNA synthetase [Streptomyces dysideae]
MPASDRPYAYAQPVLRITDARTGETVDAAPARRGLTRVEAHAPAFDPTALRVLLVADLLVRALELGGTPVWALLIGERDQAELRAGAAALGIRPFEDSRDAASGLGEAQVIHVVAEGGPEPDGVRITVAPVHTAPPPEGADPAALRLALLARRRGEPAQLDTASLADAHDTLVRWRRAVSRWAHQPSRPVPDEVRGELRTAWEDDLDIPAVLRVLTKVETEPDLPDGARFETYAYADRLLGLELTRDLGAPA